MTPITRKAWAVALATPIITEWSGCYKKQQMSMWCDLPRNHELYCGDIELNL